MDRNVTKQNGFSMVEILVSMIVVAFIALLVGFSITSSIRFHKQSSSMDDGRAIAKEKLAELQNPAATTYLNDNDIVIRNNKTYNRSWEITKHTSAADTNTPDVATVTVLWDNNQKQTQVSGYIEASVAPCPPCYHDPTGITLTPSTIGQEATEVGTFETVDPKAAHGDCFQYTLPAGVLSNDLFLVSGDRLLVNGTLTPGDPKIQVTSKDCCNRTTTKEITIHVAAVNYIITATVMTAGGNMDPVGTVTVGSGGSKTFTITPDAGFRIDYLEVNGANKGALTTYTFTNVKSNQTINVYFKAVYIITATAGAHGSITPSGSVQVDVGANQQFTIQADNTNGYTIDHVNVDNNPLAGVGGVNVPTYVYQFNNVTAPHTIDAFFVKQYTITVNQPTNGSISPGTTTLLSGGNQTFTVTANSPYTYIIDYVQVDGAGAGGSDQFTFPYTFSNVTANHTISAVIVTCRAITVTQPSFGNIAPSGTVYVKNMGSKMFTITPNSGYGISRIDSAGLNKGDTTPITFANVKNDFTLTATMGLTYTITVSTPSFGTINPPGPSVTVVTGKSKQFTMTPNSGYGISRIDSNGVNKGDTTPITFTVKNSFPLAVTFGQAYTITVNSVTNGSISPSTSQSVVSGKSSSPFTITANSGYMIDKVDSNGTLLSAKSSIIFKNVQSNQSVGATFIAIGNSLVTYTPSLRGLHVSGGSTGDNTTFRVGKFARNSQWSEEVGCYISDLSIIQGKTIDSAVFIFKLSNLNSTPTPKTINLWAQDHASYSTTAIWSYYGTNAWTSSMGTVTASAINTDYFVRGSALKTLVSSWASAPSNNKGLILAGAFGHESYYFTVSTVQLKVYYR